MTISKGFLLLLVLSLNVTCWSKAVGSSGRSKGSASSSGGSRSGGSRSGSSGSSGGRSGSSSISKPSGTGTRPSGTSSGTKPKPAATGIFAPSSGGNSGSQGSKGGGRTTGTNNPKPKPNVGTTNVIGGGGGSSGTRTVSNIPPATGNTQSGNTVNTVPPNPNTQGSNNQPGGNSGATRVNPSVGPNSHPNTPTNTGWFGGSSNTGTKPNVVAPVQPSGNVVPVGPNRQTPVNTGFNPVVPSNPGPNRQTPINTVNTGFNPVVPSSPGRSQGNSGWFSGGNNRQPPPVSTSYLSNGVKSFPVANSRPLSTVTTGSRYITVVSGYSRTVAVRPVFIPVRVRSVYYYNRPYYYGPRYYPGSSTSTTTTVINNYNNNSTSGNKTCSYELTSEETLTYEDNYTVNQILFECKSNEFCCGLDCCDTASYNSSDTYNFVSANDTANIAVNATFLTPTS